MSKLKSYLRGCQQAYYAGNPIISDSQYDMLEEICSEDLSIGTNKGRIKHWYKMYSLDKIYKGEQEYPLPVGVNIVCTHKLDGAALALRYLNNILHSVVTRGNGEYGEDISHLFEDCGMIAKNLGVPSEIDVPGLIQITGEVVTSKDTPNARNYAAGALNLKTAGQFWQKNLTFFAYDMQETQFESYMGTLFYLRQLGFNCIYDATYTKWPTDGVVHRVDDNRLFEELGYTSKFPRGAIAEKERSEGVETILLDVVWQTGKSGKVTPVAILDPINIDGATVSRATLNNPGFIEALDLQIGDSVMVERAGGIIPRIIKKAELLNTENQDKNSS